MPRLPPALWLLGLAVGVSLLTREPASRAGPAASQATHKAADVARAARVPAPAGPDGAAR
jgi:hypothetical protein